jgi:hypothetical protein
MQNARWHFAVLFAENLTESRGIIVFVKSASKKIGSTKKTKRDEWRKAGRCLGCGSSLDEPKREGYDGKYCPVCENYRQNPGIGSMKTPKYSQYSIAMVKEKVRAKSKK